MALYKHKMHLGDALAAPLQTDRADGPWLLYVQLY